MDTPLSWYWGRELVGEKVVFIRYNDKVCTQVDRLHNYFKNILDMHRAWR